MNPICTLFLFHLLVFLLTFTSSTWFAWSAPAFCYKEVISILLDTVFIFRFIAQSVPAERVAPFFPLLSAHLSCAMTHIDTSIQEDAMKILDVLLEHYPALLAARPEVLLTNFLELISHRQNSGGNKKVQDSKARTWALSVNPSRAVTSQQWRLSVLLRYGRIRYYKQIPVKFQISAAYLFFFVLRLGRFLQAVVEERPIEESDIFVPAEGIFGSRGEGKLTPLYLTWEELACRKIGVRVYEHSGAKPTPRSTFRLRYDTSLEIHGLRDIVLPGYIH